MSQEGFLRQESASSKDYQTHRTPQRLLGWQTPRDRSSRRQQSGGSGGRPPRFQHGHHGDHRPSEHFSSNRKRSLDVSRQRSRDNYHRPVRNRWDRQGSRDRYARADDDAFDEDDNTSSSDEENPRGQFTGQPGCLLENRYEYMNDLGKGTFGKVIACYDRVRQRTCAVKVVRAVARYLSSARIEGDMLERVNDAEDRYYRDLRESRCVRMFRRFQFQGHECLVFEQLGPSLLNEQERIKYKPFDMRVIRIVSRQLLEALQFLHERANIVHTDVKMENVLFVHSSIPDCSQPPHDLADRYNVKLIDFGGATFHSSQNDGTINTRQYRAPEVILQLGWDYPSDIWGAGALMMEIFLGDLLFQSNQVSEHLALMERVRGHRFPEGMRRASERNTPDHFFDRKGRVIWPRDAESLANIRGTRSLNNQIFRHRTDVNQSALNDFYEVVWGLLDLDPKRRFRAREALSCPFFRVY